MCALWCECAHAHVCPPNTGRLVHDDGDEEEVKRAFHLQFISRFFPSLSLSTYFLRAANSPQSGLFFVASARGGTQGAAAAPLGLGRLQRERVVARQEWINHLVVSGAQLAREPTSARRG